MQTTPAERRRVLAASAIGTTIEWYDFFIYSTSAALIFSSQFFTALEPSTALLASMATLGVTFFARPLGGMVSGHFGDRLGRKNMLVLTLGVMGAATVGVGLLPTYARIGVWAPIFLVLLRCLQGFSAGGEWAGAALMAVEHAPAEKRAWHGSASQIGTPLGLLLANGMFLAMVSSTTNEQFLSWGWRVPFLLSIGLVALGFYIRNRVSESPAFVEMKTSAHASRAPLSELFASHKRAVLLAAGSFLGNTVVGYIFLSFMLSYGTNTLKLPRETMLGVVMLGSVCWLLSILYAGWIADRRWATLLQQIFRVDPLACPSCHGAMRIVEVYLPTNAGSAGARGVTSINGMANTLTTSTSVQSPIPQGCGLGLIARPR